MSKAMVLVGVGCSIVSVVLSVAMGEWFAAFGWFASTIAGIGWWIAEEEK